MNKSTTKNMFKRPMIVVATLTLCLCVTGVTALAATGKLQGYFKDITNWNGAITGTTYEQATDELELQVTEVSDALTVTITMIKPDVAPYRLLETFGVESYKIVDMTGNVIVKGDRTELVEVVDGKANVMISLENVSEGEYKLQVTEMVGGSKADQPLVISGTWECEFV
ncbi:MAG: hypothetical protein IJX63_11005, partial [Lachnospiraceae bacterium]|nr:hypothetical protein [Lachnospiraceae bacterium]